MKNKMWKNSRIRGGNLDFSVNKLAVNPNGGMVTNVVLIFIFAPGAASLLYTFPMEHVMKKYMPKEEKKYTEDGEEIVAWYNE